MLIKHFKKGLFYAVIGPLIGGFVVFLMVAALLLSNEGHSDLTVYSYGAIFLVVTGWGYVVGIIPALVIGVSQSIAKERGGAQSRSHIFAKGSIITLLVLTGLSYKYVLVEPKLLIGMAFFAVIGGIASIIIKRISIARISSGPK